MDDNQGVDMDDNPVSGYIPSELYYVPLSLIFIPNMILVVNIVIVI